MSRKFVFSALAISGGSAILYAVYLYQSLSRKVCHTNHIRLQTSNHTRQGNIISIPPDVLDRPSEYRVIYDIASKSIPKSQIGKLEIQKLITKYLRRNMVTFATRLPQAWLLRRAVDSASFQRSFQPSYIEELDFVEGDVVCGIYRVEVRTADQVELAIVPTPNMPRINERLVIGVQQQGDDIVIRNETVQWKEKSETLVLPLERTMMRWMHELGSWYLLDSGTRWLVEERMAQ